jgi:RimJ/RimL family protein N-acetyltransferase
MQPSHTSDIEIRVLAPDDVLAFREARLEALNSDPKAFGADAQSFALDSLEQIAARIESVPDQKFTLGAFVDGSLSGMVRFVRFETPKECHRATIYGFYVTGKARGRGIGSAMLAKLIEQARRIDGLSTLELDVSTTQQAARALYVKFGFQTWGVLPDALRFNGESVNFEAMRRELTR